MLNNRGLLDGGVCIGIVTCKSGRLSRAICIGTSNSNLFSDSSWPGDAALEEFKHICTLCDSGLKRPSARYSSSSSKAGETVRVVGRA